MFVVLLFPEMPNIVIQINLSKILEFSLPFAKHCGFQIHSFYNDVKET